jgi:hypothetical protein
MWQGTTVIPKHGAGRLYGIICTMMVSEDLLYARWQKASLALMHDCSILAFHGYCDALVGAKAKKSLSCPYLFSFAAAASPESCVCRPDRLITFLFPIIPSFTNRQQEVEKEEKSRCILEMQLALA